MPLVVDRLPAILVQVMVLLATGLPSAVRVAVRVWVPPEETLKLEGEISRVVGIITFGPEYLPLVGSLTMLVPSYA